VSAPFPQTISDLDIRDEFAILDVKANLNEVAGILAKNEVKVVLVVERKKREVIGIITEQHFLRVCASGISPRSTTVHDYMQSNILRLRSDTPLEAALDIIGEKDPDAVIVMTGERKLCGYLSPEDVRQLKSLFSPGHGGEEATSGEEIESGSESAPAQKRRSRQQIENQPMTPSPFHRILGTRQAKAKKNGKTSSASDDKPAEFTVSEARQLVLLAMHFCSEHGLHQHRAGRISEIHDYLFCIGRTGPSTTRGIWAVHEREVAMFAQRSNSGDAAHAGADEEMYCLAWIADDAAQAPSAWLTKVGDLWGAATGTQRLACFAMDHSNSLLAPRILRVVRPTARKAEVVKKSSGGDIESLAAELLRNASNSYDSSTSRFLLCASVRR
jgi:CBS domain-containing protein